MIGIAFASIGGLIGLALVVGGIAVLAAYAFGRDDDGYFNSDRQQLDSATYAIITEDIDLGVDEVDWAPDKILGNIRVQVDSAKPVFVGIGSDDDVGGYLGGVAHDELVDFDGDDPEFEPHEGRAPRTRPGDQDFWVAASEGSGEQALTWDAEFGRWTAVVMNADAAQAKEARVSERTADRRLENEEFRRQVGDLRRQMVEHLPCRLAPAGYKTGTSSGRFSVREVVAPSGRFSVISS
jgi:hypothetical protein